MGVWYTHGAPQVIGFALHGVPQGHHSDRHREATEAEEMRSAWQFDQSKYNKHLSRFSLDLKDAFLQLYLQPDLPNCPWPEQRIVNNIVKAVAQHFHLLFFFKFDRG